MPGPLAKRTSAPAGPRKRGVKPGTPSWKKFNYTDDFIADCRRRYEETPETRVAIARDCGVSARTLRRMAAHDGWVKFRPPPVDLPGHVRLRRQVEAMAAGQGTASPFPPPLWGRVREGGPSESATATPTPNPSPQGGGEEFAARPEQDERPPLTSSIAQALRAVQAQLDEVAALRMSARTTTDRQRIASTLASLTTTLRGLQAVQSAATPAPQSPPSGYAYDDMPADLDEFRRDLARRIEAFMESRTDEGDAGEPAAARLDEA